jgi:hypothetical protein
MCGAPLVAETVTLREERKVVTVLFRSVCAGPAIREAEELLGVRPAEASSASS